MTQSSISTGRAVRFLLSYMNKYRVVIGIGIVLLMTVDMVQLIIPRIIKKILDSLGNQSFSQALILKNALIITALAVVMTIIRFCYRLFIFLPSRKIETRMRDDLFGHLMRLSFSFYNAAKTGDLMALLVNDLNAVRMATGMALIGLTDSIFMGSMSLAFMFAIDVKLTLITISPLPLIVVFMLKFGPAIQSKFTAVQESFGAVSSHAQEAFSGIRVVKGFAQEDGEVRHFSDQCDEYVDCNIKLVRLWGVLFPMIGFFASISIGLLFLFGGRQVIAGRFSLGDFVAFSFYIQLFVWPIMAFGWVYNIFQRGIASVKRLMELFGKESDVQVYSRPDAPVVRIKGEIVMRDLTFCFNEGSRDVLRSVNLTIPAGSSLGIIGRSGAGKTTLISLLFHLFPIRRGGLFIDGIDINDIPLPLLRRSIGFVPQDSFLFSDTVENNIAFGLEETMACGEKIRRAARIAAIDEEIMRFPAGYKTAVGERGITLSGGQKQRLSIARAIVLDPAVLVLDDALSSVDARIEREILSALSGEIRTRTSLIVAHRISTVRACDAIIVLDKGEIIERGSHEELLKRNGFYAKLNALQTARTGAEG